MQKIFNLLLPFLIFILASCNGASKKELDNKVWLIIQPQLELNKSATARIIFAGKPEPGSIKVSQVEKNDHYDLDAEDIAKNLTPDGTYFYYDIEFTAGRLGKANLPIIEAVIGGNTYKSTQISVDVVQKQIVDSSAIRLVLSTDKENYQKDDTISLSLHEYSKFFQRARFTPAELVKKGAPEALFAVIEEGNVDYKVGIVGFKDFIDKNFKASHFNWNVNDLGRQMATFENTSYIKTEIFSIKLVAKNSGKFKVNSSSFNYKIYPYAEAFKEELLSEEDLLSNNNRLTITSNAKEIVVN